MHRENLARRECISEGAQSEQMAGIHTSCGPKAETVQNINPARTRSCTRCEVGQVLACSIVLTTLLSKYIRSKVWGPKRRSTCPQALFDNIQSMSETFQEEKSAGFVLEGT